MSKSEVLASERGNQMVTPTEDYYPDHDGGKFAPILATTVATWRARAFLENLALDAEGAIFVTPSILTIASIATIRRRTRRPHSRRFRHRRWDLRLMPAACFGRRAERCARGRGISGGSRGVVPSSNGANFRTPSS